MIEFDKEIAGSAKNICGVDEVGRGPLAGPVVAAACVFNLDAEPISGINDSKKLSEKNRELLFEKIVRQAVAFHIAIVDNNTIDTVNILQATKMAMQEAISIIDHKADLVLVDGVDSFKLAVPCMAIVKGDSKSYAIAAASILAKVTRDRIMKKADLEYPEYAFSKHKGYGTVTHIDAIREFGLCPIHRKSFTKKFVAQLDNIANE